MRMTSDKYQEKYLIKNVSSYNENKENINNVIVCINFQLYMV